MPSTLRELIEAPERARALPPDAMAAVLGELILLLARLLVHTSATLTTTQTARPEALDRLLSVVEVATVLSLRVPRVYELIRRGRLPAVRVGRSVRIRPCDLHAWIEGQREKIMDTNFEPSLSSPPPMSRSMTKARGRKGS